MNNSVFTDYLQSYFDSDIDDIIKNFQEIPDQDLMKKSESSVLRNFKEFASKTKGYRRFLEEHSFAIENINTIEDFMALPITTKENYLLKYPLNELLSTESCPTFITSSTGSTGQPFYWPREGIRYIEIAKSFEFLMEYCFGIKGKRTLIIVSNAMGVWSAGNVTTGACQFLSFKGYDISIITPGLSLEENIKIIKQFINSEYDQFVLSAYPGFVKDILTECIKSGIDLGSKNIYIMVAGESITEEWRKYVYNQMNKSDDGHHIINFYACSEAGVVGMETQFTNALKSDLVGNTVLLDNLFHLKFIPSIVQYNPLSKYIEILDENIVITSYGTLPIFRYNTKDQGGIFLKNDIESKFSIERNTANDLNLPVLYIKGRSDIALTLYAVNIYIDNLKQITYSSDLLRYITGRFQAYIVYNDTQDQKFMLKLELNKGLTIQDIDTEEVKIKILNSLKSLNSEYNKLHETVKEKAEPIISYEEYSSSNSFSHDKPIYKKIIK